MAKGFQKNREHQEKIALLGKPLMRRSKKRCELCDAQGEAMSVMEVEPTPAVPDPDHALLICTACRTLLDRDVPDPNQARFLESVIWSDIPAVQVTAVRLCRRLADRGTDWAQDLLDTVYLSPQTLDWLGD